MRVILASASPRRRELLSQTGVAFEVITAEVDETAAVAGVVAKEGEDYPAKVVETLSMAKAAAVAVDVDEGIVIGSDTVVCDFEGEIMGKPKDESDAYRMLRRLQGRTHGVYTGVSVVVKEGGKENTHTFHCKTKVRVYPMSEEETSAYIRTGEPMDKAGAYGIQGKFGLYVQGIEGDYNSVVGLPVSALWQVLKAYVNR